MSLFARLRGWVAVSDLMDEIETVIEDPEEAAEWFFEQLDTAAMEMTVTEIFHELDLLRLSMSPKATEWLRNCLFQRLRNSE